MSNRSITGARQAGAHAEATGMNYVNMPMKVSSRPRTNKIDKVLAVLNSQDPVLPMEHDQWDRKQAMNEAKSFGMSWDQFGLKHYIVAFQPAAKRAAIDFSGVEKSQ